MRLTRAPLTSARRSLRRMRFFACGVFAIVNCPRLETEDIGKMKTARNRGPHRSGALSTHEEADGQPSSAGKRRNRRSIDRPRSSGESARRTGRPPLRARKRAIDRTRVVLGKRVAVHVELGGSSIIKKKKTVVNNLQPTKN